MNKLRVAFGADHAGFELKDFLKKQLGDELEIVDFGCDGPESVDYPDFAHKVAEEVSSKRANLGILICGSGNGINMTANKHAEIRSALCWQKDIAELARLHNDANILALPARYLEQNEAFEIVNAFLKTEFEGGRHLRRVEKI